ncbi:MAG: hypothetical protein WC812_04355 [Candidatus Pacearchaeota archaeon]
MVSNYKNNSRHKEFIRKKWVEFIKEISKLEEKECSIITLPSDEMQDLRLFKEEGIIDWEENETESCTITKGKVICFERLTSIHNKLAKKLVNATTHPYEIGRFFQEKYNKLINGETTFFPVDVINLDLDGNLSKNDTSIERILDLLFQFQKNYNKFSLFLTFPETEAEDELEFKDKLKSILNSNLSDEHNNEFIQMFKEKFPSTDEIQYYEFVTISLVKLIIKKATHFNYKLSKQEFYYYGENGRRKMISILINFEYNPNSTPGLYYSEVIKSLEKVNEL